MKKGLLALTVLTAFSLQAAAHKKNKQQGKEKVTFINEDEKARVMLTIFDYKKGKKITSKSLGARESYNYKLEKGMHYAIEAKEEGGADALSTGVYHLHVRTKDKKGTVRILRSQALLRSGDELVFEGNKEAAKEGAFVRRLILQPSWGQAQKQK